MNLEELKKKTEETPKWLKVWYAVRRWFLDVPGILRKIKWFCQRRVRGYGDDDLWQLDYVLGSRIIKCLRAYRKMKKTGVPSSFCYDEEGKQILSTEEGARAWDKVLDDMIDGFDYLVNMDDRNDDLYQKHERGEIENKEWFAEMQRRSEEAKKKAGLFIEHFNGLWD